MMGIDAEEGAGGAPGIDGAVGAFTGSALGNAAPAPAPNTSSAPSTRIDFTYLSEQDVVDAGALDMAHCIDVMDETFRLLSLGDYRLTGKNEHEHGAFLGFPKTSPFPRMPLDGPDRRFMAMPAYLGGDFHMAGVKWYGSNAANREIGLPRSILMLMLNDPDTGAPVALMSANLISSYRTAAVPALGVRYLASNEVRQVGVIGPGVMSKTALRAFLVERPMIDTVKVKGRGRRSLESFIAYVHEQFPQIKRVEAVDTEEEAIRGSDLVTIATAETGSYADWPFFARDWVKPGALICIPSFANSDEEPYIDGSWKMVTDLYPMYEAWVDMHGGHKQHGMFGNKWVDMVRAGKIARDDVVDLGDIVRGVRPGRTSDDDVFVFSIGGIPVEDVSWGTTLLRQARDRHLGVTLNLWDKPRLA